MYYVLIGIFVLCIATPKLTQMYAKHITKQTCDKLKHEIELLSQK